MPLRSKRRTDDCVTSVAATLWSGRICREAFVNVFAHNNAGARLEPRLCGMRDEGVTARTASGETQKGYEKGGGQQS